MNATQTVTIDGKQYRLEDLSDAAKAQVQNLRLADLEIKRLKMQIALAQTARNAYSQALQSELPKES